MASAILSAPSYLNTRPIICSLSNSSNSPNYRCFPWNSQMGLTAFPHQWRWIGMRQLGIPISQQSLKLERRSKCRRSSVIVASLFGVGAPEALVIGVVALLVFGPKGLAEVARNLGKTLRAFQPAIRELQDVSREFKTTLEKEIGLDEIRNPTQSNYSSTTTTPVSRTPPVTTPVDSQATIDPNGTPSPNKAYSSEDYLKITEEQLKAAASVEQKEQTPSSVTGTEFLPQPQGQDTIQEKEIATPQVQKPKDES